ncbi:ATP-grasp domain-containing protein [Halorientalis brevis]|uniref:ATP-grasp domain-containing protein n=1 Tax=Halorientalis brevis TaxID=1126241 RepID=A0ABD6CAY4_9EURY|nr:ATP-grasp domain-containing protein [Halorientalis brevis]
MEKASIVVPAASAASSVAFHRSLGRRGIRTIAVSETETAPSFRSRYCDETVLVSDPKEDITGYKEALLALAMRPDVETIVPLREEDIYVLSKYRQEFAEHIATPWPSFETLRTVHDREKLFDAARKASVPVPETNTLDDVDDWGRRLVVKSRYALLTGDYLSDSAAEGIIEPRSATFLKPDERPDKERLRSEFKHNPHVQQFVDGTEFSLGVLYDDGEPVVETQKRIIRGKKYYCGPSVYHESVDIRELEELGRRLLTQLDWHGPADIDIIRDDNSGEYKLLEINPRFWATIQMEIHAGFDFPLYYWRMTQNDSRQSIPSPEPGIASHYLPGELSYIQSVLTEDHPLCDPPSVSSSGWEITRSIIGDHRFDLLDLDDPLPFVSRVADEVRG